jgi:hypothetical protein
MFRSLRPFSDINICNLKPTEMHSNIRDLQDLVNFTIVVSVEYFVSILYVFLFLKLLRKLYPG